MTTQSFRIDSAGLAGEFHLPDQHVARGGVPAAPGGPQVAPGPVPALPLAVLLHNGFDSSLSWATVVPALLDLGFCVLTWDRIGYGKSFSPAHAPDPGCDMVVSGSDELDLMMDHAFASGYVPAGTRLALLMGHCMGGAIALDWTLRHPGRVERLVLEAMGFASSPAIRRRTDWVLQPWSELDARIKGHLEDQHGHHAALAWEHIHRHKGSYVMHPEWDQRPRLAELDCPALIMQGGRDFYFRPDEAEEACGRIRKGHLAIFPDSSHDLHLRHTEEFLESLGKFLQATGFRQAAPARES